MAYIDEGPPAATPVVLLHGEPFWSFLYRKVIPLVAGAGLRAIAPDLIGFGRSDKPARREDYTYQRHVEWVRALLLDHLDLSGMVLVGHDWGGLIGLRLVAEQPDRFAGVVAANTALPTGDQQMPEAFTAWQRYSQETPRFHIGGIVGGGCVTGLAAEVIAAYDAPFPDDSFTAGARQFPMLVPTRPDDPATPANRAAWEALARFDRPFLTAFSDSDPITRGADRLFQALVPGAKGLAHTTIHGAGHFLQEDRGHELGEVIVDFVRRAVDAPRGRER
jgi:haloalkane dehalogenase